jgi:hypothetical protein
VRTCLERDRERGERWGLKRTTTRKRRGACPCDISIFSLFIIGQYMIEENTSIEYPSSKTK